MSDITYQLILAGDLFEQELKPLVRSFFQGESLEISLTDWDEELEQVRFADGKLYYGEIEPFDVENGIIVHTGEKSFSVAFIKAGSVTSFEEGKALPDRKEYRNTLARAIYRILSKETGKTLPWGILTGVRPTKLVYERLEAGEDEASIREGLKKEYLCSDRKTDLSLKVAKREHEILSSLDYENQYSLYIGIPFCPTVCAYCSFTSFPVKGYEGLVEPYLEALFKEIDAAAKLFPGRGISSVYFGGGTPTTLSAAQLEKLILKVRDTFDISKCREFTVEAGRPDSITDDKLKVIKDTGVTRISINPQSMNDETLKKIGRRHTVKQIEEAFEAARKTGLDNINMDIILGLEGETIKEVENTLRQIKALGPESLTVHTLALKRAARLVTEKKNFEGSGLSSVADMVELTADFAAENGLLPYYLYRQKNMADNLENVGYSKKGLECLYNILIMEEVQTILALGAGGSSKFVFPKVDGNTRIERVENVKNVNHYIDRIDEMIGRKEDFLAKETVFGS